MTYVHVGGQRRAEELQQAGTLLQPQPQQAEAVYTSVNLHQRPYLQHQFGAAGTGFCLSLWTMHGTGS